MRMTQTLALIAGFFFIIIETVTAHEALAVRQIHTFTAMVSCDSATMQIIDQAIKDHPKDSIRLTEINTEYKTRVTKNIAMAEKEMKVLGIEKKVRNNLHEFAENLKSVVNKTFKQGKSIGIFSEKCIKEAKTWGRKYDVGILSPSKNSQQEHTHAHKKIAPTPTQNVSEKPQLSILISPQSLTLIDELSTMEKAKSATSRTRKDWKDMDAKAMELLKSLK